MRSYGAPKLQTPLIESALAPQPGPLKEAIDPVWSDGLRVRERERERLRSIEGVSYACQACYASTGLLRGECERQSVCVSILFAANPRVYASPSNRAAGMARRWGCWVLVITVCPSTLHSVRLRAR